MTTVYAIYYIYNGLFCEIANLTKEHAVEHFDALYKAGAKDMVIFPYEKEEGEEADDNDGERWEKGEDDEIPFWHPSHGY